MKKSFLLILSIIAFFIVSCSTDIRDNPDVTPAIPLKELDKNPYAIALAEDGKVWQWVHERGLEVKEIQQINIDNVHAVGVLGIPYTGAYSWALKNNGKLYFWLSEFPDKMEEFKAEKQTIIKVVSNESHLIYLRADKTIRGFVPFQMPGNPYAGLDSLEQIKDIAVGYQCSLVLTEEGKVYVAGNNHWLIQENKEWIRKPTEIKGLENIERIGTNHSGKEPYYAVDNQDNLYYWGQSAKDEKRPVKLEATGGDILGWQLIRSSKNEFITFIPQKRRNTALSITYLKDYFPSDKILYLLNNSGRKKYLVVHKDGAVAYHDWKTNNKSGSPLKWEGATKIEGLKLDLSYFQQN